MSHQQLQDRVGQPQGLHLPTGWVPMGTGLLAPAMPMSKIRRESPWWPGKNFSSKHSDAILLTTQLYIALKSIAATASTILEILKQIIGHVH